MREGKTTLPLIAAMQRGTVNERLTIKTAIESGDANLLDEVVRIVKRTGALEVTRVAANAEAQRAIVAADRLPKSQHSACLIELASNLLGRQA